MKPQIYYIKADPGFQTVTAAYSEQDKLLPYFEPIIAWMIEHEYGSPPDDHVPQAFVYAITVEGISEEAILCPDGKVREQHIQTFDSVDDWLKEEERRLRIKAERAAQTGQQ